MAEPKSRKKLSTRKKLVFSAILILGSLSLVEVIAWLSLWLAGQPTHSILIERTTEIPLVGSTDLGMPRRLMRLSYLDPHFGFAHDPAKFSELGELPGFAVYGDRADPSALRIVALGGSTTDPFTSRGNWPKQLQRLLTEQGTRAVVFNGGVGGRTSSQELFKLIRDVPGLRPAIVISYNGVNDLPGYSDGDHPMVHTYQLEIFSKLVAPAGVSSPVLPNFFGGLGRVLALASSDSWPSGLNLGPKVELEAWKQWEQNIRLMHAVSTELGFEYVCYLQPTLGIGPYTPTEHETAMLAKLDVDYVPTVELFYGHAEALAAQLPFARSLVRCFDGRSGLYGNPRHPSSEGYELVARAILSDLKERGLVYFPR